MTQTSYLVLPPGSRCYADHDATKIAKIGDPVAYVTVSDMPAGRSGGLSQRPTLDRMDGDSPVLRFENDDSIEWLSHNE